MKPLFTLLSLLFYSASSCFVAAQTEQTEQLAQEAIPAIPLPEHPRPDFERIDWINLNGTWQFTFNADLGQIAAETSATAAFDRQINVPFGWGSPLSGVTNDGNRGFYARDIFIPRTWRNQRIFLVIGACDWDTQIYFNGRHIASHQGGYTPFEVEITWNLTGFDDVPQHLVIIADDTPNDQRLSGKQGYGDVRGIWQTVYLEARGDKYIDYVHFQPYVENEVVRVEVGLSQPLVSGEAIRLHFPNGEEADYTYTPSRANRNETVHSFHLPLHNQHLWSLDDPYLYNVEVSLTRERAPRDIVKTYFGQRTIRVDTLPGTNYPYVVLNGKPIYLQLTLDQSYNPQGYYTYPSDEAMRRDIEISKELGLNGNRIHIKAEVPRKLYWADRLGLLIMQDTPNWWADDNPIGRADWEHCMRGQIKRDFNHPSIFAWVNFNETWGLFSTRKADGFRRYHWTTQQWVEQMYLLTKQLDPTRLVEDNSPCNFDHVRTDLNTWHAYLPGTAWEAKLDEYCAKTYEGSLWNFTGEENRQTHAPMLNSECGNVWGYKGSTGDVDITWDYHQMINAFRAHPKCAGWLYTEHHDVINEWNGYVRYDRSPKVDGLDDFVPGMTMRDFHSPYFISPRCPLIQNVTAQSQLSIERFLSIMTDKDPGVMMLETSIAGWDDLGQPVENQVIALDPIVFKAYANEPIHSVTLNAPKRNGLYVVRFILRDGSGNALHRNFVLLHVNGGTTAADTPGQKTKTFTPFHFSKAVWSEGNTFAMGGNKVNGFGSGYFEYTVVVPDDIQTKRLKSATLLFEASAKRLNGKDRPNNMAEGDFMRGQGTADPSALPNSYPQTDFDTYPTKVIVSINGQKISTLDIPDDPADHRGALSWQMQSTPTNDPNIVPTHDFVNPSRTDNLTLDEAGSYGYLQEVNIPTRLLKPGHTLTIRFEVPSNPSEGAAHGLAIYGANVGPYPLNPTLLFQLK